MRITTTCFPDPNHVAIKISLELKKLLVDNSLLDVLQFDLEAILFKLLQRRGYGEEYINRYKMMTRFHHLRVPLIILVCGTSCAGKSTIATQISQRLHLTNVMQTNVVYELLRTATDAPLGSTPLWAREFSSSEELITEFCRECRIVRKGLAGDLKKAVKDGKPLIIEGIHLDPNIFLMDYETKSPSPVQKKTPEADPFASYDCRTNTENDSLNIESHFGVSNCTEQVSSEQGTTANKVNKVSDYLEAIGLARSVSENKGAPETVKSTSVKKEKSAPAPIIIPLVLKMAELDHNALLEEWLSTCTCGDKFLGQLVSENNSPQPSSFLFEDKDKIIRNLKTIQDYLCSFSSEGLKVLNLSAATFNQSLDWLHGYLLECIEQGISPMFNENGRRLVEN